MFTQSEMNLKSPIGCHALGWTACILSKVATHMHSVCRGKLDWLTGCVGCIIVFISRVWPIWGSSQWANEWFYLGRQPHRIGWCVNNCPFVKGTRISKPWQGSYPSKTVLRVGLGVFDRSHFLFTYFWRDVAKGEAMTELVNEANEAESGCSLTSWHGRT